MSAEKYPCIFSRQIAAIVYISSDFSPLGLRPRRLSIRRYFARFRRISVKYTMVAKPMKSLELHYLNNGDFLSARCSVC